MSKKKQPPKIGKIELTEQQRNLIAENLDSEFFKLIENVILPQRITQIALTLLHAGQEKEDLRFYQGQVRTATWFRDFLLGAAEPADTADYNNDDEDLDADDDTPD